MEKKQTAVIKYYKKEGRFGKVFSVKQALKGGWGVDFRKVKVFEDFEGIKLVDRNKPSHVVTIKAILEDDVFYKVYFNEGGWQLLDHCIEQFQVSQEFFHKINYTQTFKP